MPLSRSLLTVEQWRCNVCTNLIPTKCVSKFGDG